MQTHTPTSTAPPHTQRMHVHSGVGVHPQPPQIRHAQPVRCLRVPAFECVVQVVECGANIDAHTHAGEVSVAKPPLCLRVPTVKVWRLVGGLWLACGWLVVHQETCTWWLVLHARYDGATHMVMQ